MHVQVYRTIPRYSRIEYKLDPYFTRRVGGPTCPGSRRPVEGDGQMQRLTSDAQNAHAPVCRRNDVRVETAVVPDKKPCPICRAVANHTGDQGHICTRMARFCCWSPTFRRLGIAGWEARGRLPTNLRAGNSYLLTCSVKAPVAAVSWLERKMSFLGGLWGLVKFCLAAGWRSSKATGKSQWVLAPK